MIFEPAAVTASCLPLPQPVSPVIARATDIHVGAEVVIVVVLEQATPKIKRRVPVVHA